MIQMYYPSILCAARPPRQWRDRCSVSLPRLWLGARRVYALPVCTLPVCVLHARHRYRWRRLPVNRSMQSLSHCRVVYRVLQWEKSRYFDSWWCVNFSFQIKKFNKHVLNFFFFFLINVFNLERLLHIARVEFSLQTRRCISFLNYVKIYRQSQYLCVP